MAGDMKLDVRLIRQLREDRGWSQEQLAAVSGLSARTVQRLETGGSASLESRSALAAAFGVDAIRLDARAGAGDATAVPAREPGAPVAAFKWVIALCAVLLCVLYLSQMLGKFLYYATH